MLFKLLTMVASPPDTPQDFDSEDPVEPTAAERRQHRRYEVSFLARGLGLPGYVVRGEDLGLGGFRLRLNEKPPRQVPMELVLECGGVHLKVVAQCRWSHHLGEDHTAGFEFEPLNPTQQKILTNYLLHFN